MAGDNDLASLQSVSTTKKLPSNWDAFLELAGVLDRADGKPFLGYVSAKSAKQANPNAKPPEEAQSAVPEAYSCASKKLKAAFSTAWNSRELSTASQIVKDGYVLGLDPASEVDVGSAADLFELYGIELTDDTTMDTVVKQIVEVAFKSTTIRIVPTKSGDRQERRNAIWFLPGEEENFELTTAITYRLSNDFAQAFSQLANILASNDAFGVDLQKLANKISQKIDQSTIEFKIQQSTFGSKFARDDPELNLVISQTFRVLFAVTAGDFVFNLEYSPSGLQVDIREAPNVGTDLWTRIRGLFQSSDSPPSLGDVNPKDSDSSNNDGGNRDIFPELHLWNAALGQSPAGGVWWALSFAVKWRPKSQDVWIGLSYDTRVGIFTGQLLFANMFPSGDDLLLPYWSPLEKPPVDNLSTQTLDLSLLFDEIGSNVSSLPKGIPTQLTDGTLAYDKAAKTLSLSATIKKVSADQASDNAVPAPFEWNEIRVDVSKSPSTFSGRIFSSFTLNPLPEDVEKYRPADLVVDITYLNGVWQFTGRLTDFQLGVLAEYTDPDCSSAFIDVLGKVVVKRLLLDYTYDRRLASSFLFQGTIELGKLQLDLNYQFVSSSATKTATQKRIESARPNTNPLGRAQPLQKPASTDPKQATWSFEAYLSATSTGATLGEVAESIMEGAASSLPSFVSDIQIPAASNQGDAPVSLKVSKPDGSKSRVIFTLNIELKGISLTFVQLSDNGNSKTRSLTPPKRLLRISVAELPLVKDIPIVQELPQPFEKMQYVWVMGGATAAPWQRADIEAANDLLDSSDKLYFKQTNKTSSESRPELRGTDDAAEKADTRSMPSTTPPPTRPALATGHHFIVVNGGEVILDHVFGNAKSTAPPPKSIGSAPAPAQGGSATGGAGDQGDVSETGGAGNQGDASVTSGPEPAPTKGTLKMETKLLSIQAISLQFKEGYLWITVDATVALGPIGMSLLGFGIGVPLAIPGFKISLDNFDLSGFVDQLQWKLSGLGVSFEKPPLTMAGVFEHEIAAFGDGSKESYRGGIGVSFPPYTFVAVGEYSKVTLMNKDYKSVFVYAKLDGPLITLEFATISGVRLGFGYNSSIRSPVNVDEVTGFPFINDAGIGGVGNNPIKLLRALTAPTGGGDAWVSPKEDAYWFALGMTISSFDILAITACAIFSFKEGGIVIDLYANAIAQMPPQVTDAHEMILYVEIDLHACLNFLDGYFLCEAALAPTSFLLVPQCHLYGGFALCYWFGSNPHAGDWVFSVGGYHRAFQAPAHYPKPRRLGISFVVGNNIRIVGEGYFAITPKAVMGGAMIHVSLDVGPVSAYLDAAFDALINFHPIHYIVDAHVSVGVSCSIDIGLISIRISISIGADLHIEGPEFGGVAHVDFWFFAFNIYFGSHGGIPPPLSLGQFLEQVRKAGPPGGNVPDEDKTADSLDVELKHNLETGNFPMPTKEAKDKTTVALPDSEGAGAKWFVKGGSFSFRVSADFALSDACVANAASDASKAKGDDFLTYTSKAVDVQDGAKPSARVYSVPMQVNESNQKSGISSVLYVAVYKKNADGTREIPKGWKTTYVVKDVPAALWAAYDPNKDPMRPGSDKSELLKPDGATIRLPMGVTLKAPDPILAPSKIPDFNATEMAKAQVKQKDGSDWLVPTATLYDPASVGTFPPALLSNPEKDASGAVRWNAIKTEWRKCSNQGAGIASSLADLYSTGLGWDQPSPAAKSELASKGGVASVSSIGPLPWDLNTARPKRLVDGTGTRVNAGTVDGLENFYMTLPRLGVVTA